MIKCSANYCKSNNNFVIIGIDENKDAKVDYSQTIKIVKNIINRGAPTLMSKFLREKIQYDLKNDNDEYKLISSDDLVWDRTIKGYDPKLDYPAIEFYNDILPNYLGEYSFVRNLMLPEASINDLVNKPLESFVNCSVDFYIPQIKLVIEIDGKQHDKEKNKDFFRDLILEKSEIKVIRIKAFDIKEKNNNLISKINEIKGLLYDSKDIQNYKNNIDKKYLYKENLVSIIRLQITILEMLLNGAISFEKEWRLDIKGISEENIKLAISDLQNWFSLIFNLQKISIDFPKVNLVNDSNSIKIDCDIYKRYDNTCNENSVIYIRNDYFENDKNYYKVEYDDNFKYLLDFNNKEDRNNLTKILKNLFGFNSFRDGQAKIIMNLLNLRDSIGILPTGSGKSLCYQLSALLQPGVSIIISPLKSLIKDQYDSMRNIYINNTEKIDSTMETEEKAESLDKISNNKCQLVWVSPERFQMNNFRECIKSLSKKFNVSYGIIDEVHCMSEWGHDFRTSYLHLVKAMHNYMPKVTLAGLTATASDRVLKDLKVEFNITNDYDIITTLNFIRKELHFKVYNWSKHQDKKNNSVEFNNEKEILEHILKEIYKNKSKLDYDTKYIPGLIFTLFAKGPRGAETVEDVIKNMSKEIIQNAKNKLKENNEQKSIDEKVLEEKNIEYDNQIDHFHSNAGEYPTEEEINEFESKKIDAQDNYKKNTISLLIATKAFGMGIDKPNIRYIINYGIPASFEEFYQEVGRAGRDGKDSYCYIIHQKTLYNDKLKKIFYGIDTNVSELYKTIHPYDPFWGYIENPKWGKGDAFDQMIFFTNNKSNNEWQKIYNTYLNIKNKNNNNFKIYKNVEKEEKNIYKLSLLGIVTDWTIDYTPSKVIKGEIANLTETEVIHNLENYIRKYEYDFYLNSKFMIKNSIKYKDIYEIMKDEGLNRIQKCIKILCTWYDENVLYSRRRAIEQIDDFFSSLDSGKDCTDEINKKIYKYFKSEDYNVILTLLEGKKADYNKALEMIAHKSVEKLEEVKTSVDRLLVTNRYNAILNVLDGILKIKLNIEDDLHEDEFEYGIKKISENVERDKIYEMILDSNQDMSLIQKNKLNDRLEKYFNSKDDYILNYKYLKTDKVLKKIIEKENIRIHSIEGDAINGSRKNGSIN